MDKPIRHREPARGKLAGLCSALLQCFVFNVFGLPPATLSLDVEHSS